MTRFVALLRGINLGKRQLKMADLRALAIKDGLSDPSTFIASGNLLFASDRGERDLAASLSTSIGEHLGKPVPVLVSTAKEMAAVVAANPFADQPGNRVVAIFLDDAPAGDAEQTARNVDGERIALGKRELYVHYPNGQGPSKLQIPAAANGTARNMNTVAKLADLLKEPE